MLLPYQFSLNSNVNIVPSVGPFSLYSSSSNDINNNNNSPLRNLSFDYCTDLDESDYRQVLFCEDIPCATRIRQSMDDTLFGDPRQPSSARFVWDNWFVTSGQGIRGQTAPLPHHEDSVPGEQQAAANQVQYSLTRAQCSNILSDEDMTVLMEDLMQLAQFIGCTEVTPPWLSIYTDGNMQNFHTDAPQGPMAWTLSLSKGYGTTFTGGETMLLSPKILDYWRDFDPTVGLEAPSIIRYLPPTFGRFVAFDPRVPHSVQQVRGTTNPQAGRIMIHGWMALPQIIYVGDMTEELCGSILNDALEHVTAALQGELGRVIGFLVVRLQISVDGTVESVVAVCDTIQADPADFRGVVGYDDDEREVLEDAPTDVKLTIREALAALYFNETANGGAIVVPFDFV